MAPVSVECPIEGCNYAATHADAAVVAALLSVHASVHVTVPRALGANAKIEKIKRLTVALAGTGEAWSYFVTRWGEYNTGTKLVGPDVVAQLLECCEEELRKYLTRAARPRRLENDQHHAYSTLRMRVRSAVRIGDNKTYATGEESGRLNRKPSPKRYASTAASWVTVRHPRGILDAPNALRMVKSARNVAARITSTRRA